MHRILRIAVIVLLVLVPCFVLMRCLGYVESEFPTHVKFADVEGYKAARRLRGLEPSRVPQAAPPRAPAPRARKPVARAPKPRVHAAAPRPCRRAPLLEAETRLTISKEVASDGGTVYVIRQERPAWPARPR